MTERHVLPRIALWTPLPPLRSGISEYSEELLDSLSPLCDVEVFVDSDVVPLSTLGDAYAVRRAEEYHHRHALYPFDANIYHLGNNFHFHEGIYERVLQEPGIAVLHDVSLFDLYRALLVARGKEDEFLAEVEYNHGLESRAVAMDILLGHRPLNRFEMTLVRHVVEASNAVIVHSRWAREYLQRRYPHRRVYYVPEAAPILNDGAGPDIRSRNGWPNDQFVIGVFGGWSPIKRLHIVVDAFRYVRREHPNAQLVLAGRMDDIVYAGQLQAAIRDLGLEDSIKLLSDLPMDQFQGYLQAVDVVVNLRWPSAGETSATMMRAFGAGKVVITSDMPQVREYDETFCRRLPPETAEEGALLVETLLDAANNPEETRHAGRAARDFMVRTATWPKVAEQYRDIVEATAACTGEPPFRSRSATTTIVQSARYAGGLNLVGDLDAASGLSEAARNTVHALRRQGTALDYTELEYEFENRATGPTFSNLVGLHRGNSYPFNVMFYNLNVLHHTVSPERLEALTNGKYTIAFWFWELPRIPDDWVQEFDRVDEIWVSSEYTREAMMTVANTPVVTMPIAVDLTLSPIIERSTFGLPDDRYIFLFNFSAMSCGSRKNPWSLIDGFESAFGRPDDGPLLVIKAHHLDRYPEMRDALRSAVERVGGMLIESSYTRQEMNDLLACADAFVSLHRSEGFGLGIAESMFLGKPVIATDYSANVDFMNPKNSYPVRYRLRAITDEDHRYQPDCAFIYDVGQLWADPDVEHAAGLMRHLYENPDDGRKRGFQAALDIREYCGMEAVGHRINARLAVLERERPQPRPKGPRATNAWPEIGDLVTRNQAAVESWQYVRQLSESVPLGNRPGIGWLVRGMAHVPIVGHAIRGLQRLRFAGALAERQDALNSLAVEQAQALSHAFAAIPTAVRQELEPTVENAARTDLTAQRLHNSLLLAIDELRQRRVREEERYLDLHPSTCIPAVDRQRRGGLCTPIDNDEHPISAIHVGPS